jgi:hypothetical protein
MRWLLTSNKAADQKYAIATLESLAKIDIYLN